MSILIQAHVFFKLSQALSGGNCHQFAMSLYQRFMSEMEGQWKLYQTVFLSEVCLSFPVKWFYWWQPSKVSLLETIRHLLWWSSTCIVLIHQRKCLILKFSVNLLYWLNWSLIYTKPVNFTNSITTHLKLTGFEPYVSWAILSYPEQEFLSAVKNRRS